VRTVWTPTYPQTADPEVLPVAETGFLVPVADTDTVRGTVTHAVETAIAEGPSRLHLVYVASWRGADPGGDDRSRRARELLDDAARWAEFDRREAGSDVEVTVETAVLGGDEYLFGADGYATELLAYADECALDEVILDPEYAPVGTPALLRPLEYELSRSSVGIREAPVERPSRRGQLVGEFNPVKFASVFGVSLAFYLLLGDPTYAFDLVTGVATATVTATALSRVSLGGDPTFPGSVLRIVRLALYVPVLLVAILKANLVVAAVILRPSLPIEPRLTRMRVLVGSGLPVTTLANSITLTPGTLTVRARDDDLYVHALVPSAREGLFAGSLERWTRFIYYGREAARLPTPEERDDCAVLQGPEADEPFHEAIPAGVRPAADGGRPRDGAAESDGRRRGETTESDVDPAADVDAPAGRDARATTPEEEAE